MTKKEDGGGGGERRKGSIGHILRGIFRKNDEKDGKREEKVKRQKSESAAAAMPVVEVDFGIETTEVLSHYRRARPPQNRRRPKTRQCQVRVCMKWGTFSMFKWHYHVWDKCVK